MHKNILLCISQTAKTGLFRKLPNFMKKVTMFATANAIKAV